MIDSLLDILFKVIDEQSTEAEVNAHVASFGAC